MIISGIVFILLLVLGVPIAFVILGASVFYFTLNPVIQHTLNVSATVRPNARSV